MRYLTCNYTVTLNWGYGSLKVMGTVMDRFAIYDFLLTFHSNHGPIVLFPRYMVISVENPKIFPTPSILRPTDGIPLGIGYRRWDSKTRMMGLPGRKEI